MTPEEQPNQTAGVDYSTNPSSIAIQGEPTDTVRVPVIEEQLEVSKRMVETGQVRLIKTIQEGEQTVSIPLMAEQIDIERVVVDQFVDKAPTPRQEGDTTIYPVLKEEYVIQKRLRLVEEIRVTRRQVQTTDQQTVVLRREEVVVERIPASPTIERSDSTDESSL